MSVMLPPVPTTLEEVNRALEEARKEHKHLLTEIAEAKQFMLTKEVQQKQIADHFLFLEKEHKRISEWDKSVSERETNHYTLQADTGHIFGDINGIL